MYLAILLPAAPLVSLSPSSVSPTANVGLSLRSGRPTDTPFLTLAKFRTSLPVKLSTPPTTCSHLSEMAAKASRVRNIMGQIQMQALTTSSIKPVDQSPASPHPPPPIGPTSHVASQTNKGITSTSKLPTSQDGRPQEIKDLEEVQAEVVIEAADEEKELVERSSEAYWTTLAPNVEDYNSSTARLIATGSWKLIRGFCGVGM
ncbi:hypothetical protein LWI28_023672 [Acer negundo]|uniref:Uncharacterized protein n=1 Tax=Acer negundo TaxID=4023 RepID=A0AAD5IRF3_ACENE|nr:hypothetical protein LWI28_023672 [Acer negundo]